MGQAETSLQTDRLVLRRLSFWDGAFVLRLVSQPKTRRYLGGVQPFFQRMRHLPRYWDGLVFRCVWQRPRICFVSLSQHIDGEALELSYQFLPASWGQGLATEACGAVLSYADQYLSDQKVIAETQIANGVSIRVLQKLGFKEKTRVSRHGAEHGIYQR